MGEQRAQTRSAVDADRPSVESLDALRGFRVEWDDGSVGVAGGTAIFVRTAGFGSGRRKLELLPVEDVLAILPEERRILARTRAPRAAAIGDAVRRALARELGRVSRRRGQPGRS